MRITGGAWRSRGLVAPRGLGTRPTTDRVREALFSILASRGAGLVDGRVLDLFAGTGALGLEALSRGAAHVTFVERDRDALKALHANVTSLGAAKQTRVVAQAVERALPQLAGPWDLVFADPPWDDVDDVAPPVLGGLAASLAPGGLVVLEHRAGAPAPEVPVLELEETRRYGDTALAFYVAPAGVAPDGPSEALG